MTTTALVIRRVRLVPVGTPAPTDEPVDIRIGDGVITEITPGLRPAGDEHLIDGAGRWAVPGLWDQHVHMQQWARTRLQLNLSGTSAPGEVTRLVADYVAALPVGSGTVVHGFGYRSATWATRPTVAELDAVSGEHPVVLVSGDGHNGWLNSAALALLGMSPRTGPLEENDWFAVHPRLADLPGTEQKVEAGFRAAVIAAAAKGVVGIADFELSAGYTEWPERIARGIDQLRVRPATYPDRLEEVIAAGLRTGQELDGSGLLTMGPLKIISDGSLNTRMAWCCEPYADAASLEAPRGKPNNTASELHALLHRATGAGLDVAVHAIGDAAVQAALDAFTATEAHGSIEHAQLVRSEDIARMGRLGVRASVQPAHLLDDRDVTERCWPDRADRCFPLRSLHQAGVTLALGSDAPVAPLDPWLAMAAAVHRSGDARGPWNPAESLTAPQALAASTDGRRTLAPGGPGDVVLLDDNPLRSAGGDADAIDSAAVAAHLRGVRVAATVVAGRTTHLDL